MSVCSKVPSVPFWPTCSSANLSVLQRRARKQHCIVSAVSTMRHHASFPKPNRSRGWVTGGEVGMEVEVSMEASQVKTITVGKALDRPPPVFGGSH
eukprot:2543099-Rhodomonas_salina.1